MVFKVPCNSNHSVILRFLGYQHTDTSHSQFYFLCRGMKPGEPVKDGQRNLPVVPGWLIPRLAGTNQFNASALQHPYRNTLGPLLSHLEMEGISWEHTPRQRWEHCLDKDFKSLSPTESETMPSFEQRGA